MHHSSGLHARQVALVGQPLDVSTRASDSATSERSHRATDKPCLHLAGWPPRISSVCCAVSELFVFIYMGFVKGVVVVVIGAFCGVIDVA